MSSPSTTSPSEESSGEAMAAADRPVAGTTLHRWYTFATSFVAPASFLSALLFYFGYVSSRARLAYFGVDVDTVGLSTRDYVLRSPAALLAPLLLIALFGTCLALLQQRLARREIGIPVVHRVGLVGWLLVVLGVALVFAFAWVGRWAAYPMVTPLVLTVGFLVLSWAWHRQGVRRTATAMVLVAAATCIFWATATLAQWTGLGVAQRTARHLGELPAVVIDSKERLYFTDGVTEESRLPRAQDQDFHYRYRGLRLLIHADDRMFLVPQVWTPAGSTVVVPMDDVRVRFRFVNDPP